MYRMLPMSCAAVPASGCRAFAMDTRSKLRWESPPLTDQTVQAFKEACQKFGFGPEQVAA